jgi:hypothetical protein
MNICIEETTVGWFIGFFYKHQYCSIQFFETNQNQRTNGYLINFKSFDNLSYISIVVMNHIVITAKGQSIV